MHFQIGSKLRQYNYEKVCFTTVTIKFQHNIFMKNL